ncbi:MAG: SDR family oxidoreductase [Candidatus Omnitrophota bacterium]
MAESELKNKKILVTGGAGFIGSHIAEKLVRSGVEVVVIDNLVSGKLANIEHIKNDIIFIEKDLRDDSALEQALYGVDYVCHQAALRSVPKSVNRPWDYNDVNVNGSLKLFLKEREKGIKRIICASSSSVYGDREDFPEKEGDFLNPISPYAATKLIVEHYAGVFNRLYGMEIVNLRYFNVFGQRQSLDDDYAVVVPKFITCLLNNQSPPIYGDGEQQRDFTYIDNVVDINIHCLAKCNIQGDVFNVACGEPYSVNALFNILKKIIGSNSEPQYCPPRPGDVRKTHADISKARQILDWQPKVRFEEGIERTVAWFRKQNSLES